MEIGFVILSHNNPEMLRRLIRRLNQSFDAPPIVCHHDFHQLPLAVTDFPENTRFVEKPVRTRWGHVSLVQAFRIALRQLYEWKPADWFVFLSASDYPIKRGDRIVSELSNSPFDAYLDHRCVPDYSDLPEASRDCGFELAYGRPYWLKEAYNRYVARNLRYPGVNRKGQPCLRRLPIRHPRWIGDTPFREGFRCYAGDAWLTARARCAEALFSDSECSRRLLDYYRNRLIPDESFFHTVLCNYPGLKLCNDNKRYADWRAGRPSPKMLGIEDLPALLDSSHHFARKFSEDHDLRILEELDRFN